ncbi:MAG: restriction endonuclease [Clostridiaceae bacterium]|nr:restriction endonuclease [Clostridiaceae bacterium]
MTPQELKNSILQLAIQGKLVEQRPEEGSAEELYQQIQKEKAKLVKEGKIKKGKCLPEIAEDEKRFDIPETWKWVRLNTVISLLSGADLTPNKYNSLKKGIPYITGASNIENGNVIINRWTEYPNNIAHDGDLLLTCKGTVGKTTIVQEKEVHIARQVMAITTVIVDTNFIRYFVENQVEGLKSKAKSMIPGIERDNVLKLVLPLPPLAEQKRIVAKIEELLPYIDRYEHAWSKLEDFNKRFPTDMQKSILQMAIQGKLVEQHPEEGTGEELFQQIQSEKQRLIKAGTIRKEKPLPDITEDEIPFEIPESWVWKRLGALFSIERGSSPRPIQAYLTTSEDGVNWIKIGDSEAGAKYITSTCEKITQEGAKKSRLVNIGDFIISNSMSFGRPYIMAINGYVHDGWNIIHIIKLKDGSEFNKDYLYYVLSSNLLIEQMKDKAAGGVVKNIRSDSLRNLIIPLPPLSEQKRIVDKLEELSPLCEKLK